MNRPESRRPETRGPKDRPESRSPTITNTLKIQTKIKCKTHPEVSKNRRGFSQLKATFFAYKQTRNVDIL